MMLLLARVRDALEMHCKISLLNTSIIMSTILNVHFYHKNCEFSMNQSNDHKHFVIDEAYWATLESTKFHTTEETALW